MQESQVLGHSNYHCYSPFTMPKLPDWVQNGDGDHHDGNWLSINHVKIDHNTSIEVSTLVQDERKEVQVHHQRKLQSNAVQRGRG